MKFIRILRNVLLKKAKVEEIKVVRNMGVTAQVQIHPIVKKN